MLGLRGGYSYPCAHEAGKEYGGVLCWHELINPTDAYEWSFVAVPAQKKAGVTNGKGLFCADEDLLKSLERGGSVTLSKAQAQGLADQIRKLDTLAQSGRFRLDELRRKMVTAAVFAAPALDAQIVQEVAASMDERQLEAFCKGFVQIAPPFLQLGSLQTEKTPDNREFLI